MQELLLLIVAATETAGSALIVQTGRLFAFWCPIDRRVAF